MLSKKNIMIKTAIIGATGYTGSELVRLAQQHPEMDLVMITSESQKGKKFSDIHPQFSGIMDMELVPAEAIKKADIDVAFLALPHGVSMNYVKELYDYPFKIIDLSGDYRLSGPGVYESWYKKPHIHPEGFSKAVYGLPELHRAAITTSKLVANPGCYPTSSILGLAPLIKSDLVIQDQTIIDAKSGITGAGIKAKPTTHFPSVNDNFQSYGIKSHRHTIEIEEQLQGLASSSIGVQFTPHLLPIDRGILATIYARPKGEVTTEALNRVYASFYENHPFVRIRQQAPNLKQVRGTNYCDLFVTYDERTNRIIVVSVIDNLVKGAAGQAIQNLNIMFGIEETAGIAAAALVP